MPSLTATYRLQLNAGFTLADARAHVEYLVRLGVSHIYCSPVLAARAGSTHGYDVVDPARINSELGTETDLRALSQDLHARDMGLVLDIVPNHMGMSAENPYWDSVLAHGERSRYARWFDIDWSSGAGGRRTVTLPILGDDLDRVLERGELVVRLEPDNAPRIGYHGRSFPIDPSTLPPDLQLAQLDPDATRELISVYSGAGGRDRLGALLDAQHYRLASFRHGESAVNYRRFFDVTDLVGLRVEDPEVFAETHALILRLVRDGVVDGLRIDHIDGLADPEAYLTRLRASVGADTPVFVEKILARGEQLPSSWPVQGTTGYDFLNELEDVFIEPKGYAEIERRYRRLRRLRDTTFRGVAHAAKRAILEQSLRADVERLAGVLGELPTAAGNPCTLGELASAIIELAAAFPVYRTYIDPSRPPSDADRDAIERASRDARARNAEAERAIAFITEVLLGTLPAPDEPARGESARAIFIRRFQQLTGPAAAKGIEDDALYVYMPLVSRNEVGGAPDGPLDGAIARLHDANAHRATHWPLGLLCTTTHDTKRSADVRSRLDALSELPHEWDRCVGRWRRLNRKHRRAVKGRMAPDGNTEYLLYQTLVALWPAPRLGRRIDDLPDRRWRETACERLGQYIVKAAREARVRTSWNEPDAAYERATTDFVSAILQPGDDAPFLADVARFVSLVAPLGAWNALARIALHLTSPGTPDIYQGDEFWNYALVDPDNRRPVDFETRCAATAEFAEIEQRLASADAIDPFDNRVKLFVVARLLEMRRRSPDLFARGAYRPLPAIGARAEHVIAFAREYSDRHAIVIASRFAHGLLTATPAVWWGDTAVPVPAELRDRSWASQIIPGQIEACESMNVASVLVKLPMVVAVG